MNNIPVRTRQVSNMDTAFETYIQESEEEKLYKFVNEQIDKMNKYSDLGNPNGMPGFYELNEALINYNQVQTSLVGLDVIAKQEAYKAEQELKDKQSEWYLEARNELNPPSLSASKWYSSTEIDAYVRVHHRDELRKLMDIYNSTQSKVAFLRRMLDSWQNQSLILNRLCKNIETEAIALYNGNSITGNN